MKKKIKVLISACLLGDNVKYSGGNNLTPELVTLLEKYNVDIVKVCPECFAGLPIPRLPSEIKEGKVYSKDGRDITEEFLDGAEKTYEVAERKQADFAILKERSPSCGSSYIYDGSFSGKVIEGQGFTTIKLNEENIIVFSEENLEEIEKYLEKLLLDELGQFTCIKDLVEMFKVSKTIWYDALEEGTIMYFTISSRKIIVTRSLLPFLREAMSERY